MRQRLVRGALATALMTATGGLGAAAGGSAAAQASLGTITFQAGVGAAGSCCALYSVDAAGGTPTTVVTDRVGDDPEWSPDAGALAFAGQGKGGAFDIWLYRPGSSGGYGASLTQLTDSKARDTSPAWTPDGKQIVFISNRTGNFDVWIMNADGTGQRDLSNSPAANDCGCGAPFAVFAAPSVAPDGSRIAFTSDSAAPGANLDVYVMNIDGSGLTRLTTDPGVDAEPEWSPDGHTIVFESNRTGSYQLYAMSSHGANLRRLTHDAGNDMQPAFSPDGAQLAYVSDVSGGFEVYRMNTDGTGAAPVTTTAVDTARPDWTG